MEPGRRTRAGTEFSPFPVEPRHFPTFTVERHVHNGLASIDAEASDDEDNEASFVPALQPTRALHYPERAGPLAIAINSRAGYKRRARMSKRIADAAIHSARTKVHSVLASIKSVSRYRRLSAVTTDRLPTAIDTSASTMGVSKSGWSGVNARIVKRQSTMEELVAQGFEVVDWDGCTTRPLVDANGVVFAVLAGRPNDPTYLECCSSIAKKIRQAGAKFHFTKKQVNGRRGQFNSASVGVSFGGGQTVFTCYMCATYAEAYQRPQNMAQANDSNWWILFNLLSLTELIRIAGFANSMFRLYAPLVFAMYKETADALFDSDKSLLRNFAKCVWTAATFNFGPRTVTFPHIDALNLAWGWCAIIALGLFNADLGGHLVLWDLKLIIRFPAGSTILIPSALLRHSNLPIQDHESRYSFTQFAAAGLFRWVYNGFKSDKTFNATASKVTKAARREENAKRRMEGFKLFSTWKELSSM